MPDNCVFRLDIVDSFSQLKMHTMTVMRFKERLQLTPTSLGVSCWNTRIPLIQLHSLKPKNQLILLSSIPTLGRKKGVDCIPVSPFFNKDKTSIQIQFIH